MQTLHSCVALGLTLALAACGSSSDGAWDISSTGPSAALAVAGSGSFTADGRSVSLNGGDGGAGGGSCASGRYGFADSPCSVQAKGRDLRGTYTFDWTYSTADSSGPSADMFGMVVDGKVVALSDPGGDPKQSGRATVTVAGSLSFFVNCTDCTDGAAQAAVANFRQQ